MSVSQIESTKFRRGDTDNLTSDATTIPTINFILSHLINQDLIIRDAAQVFDFLLHNPPELIQAIEAARKRTREVFLDEPIYLEMYFDPEERAGNRLIITIATALDAEEAGVKWDEIHQNNGLDDNPKLRTKLAFDFEFR